VRRRAARGPCAQGSPDPRRRGGIRRPGPDGGTVRSPVHSLGARPDQEASQVAAMSLSAHKLRCTGRMGAGRWLLRVPLIRNNFLRRTPIGTSSRSWGALGLEHRQAHVTPASALRHSVSSFFYCSGSLFPHLCLFRGWGPSASECM
jgi:hypothetical protein